MKKILFTLLSLLCTTMGWAQSAVTVGSQGFSDIQAAIRYINDKKMTNATLTLHQDCTIEGNSSLDIYFKGLLTIDLNGHSITGGLLEAEPNLVIISNDRLDDFSTLTIADNSQDKKGKLFNCSLILRPATKLIVGDGVSLYPRFVRELLLSEDFPLVNISAGESSLENHGDIYGRVLVNEGGSFINYGRVACVDGPNDNRGGFCAYFKWADDGSSFSAYIDDWIYDYDEEDEDTSISSKVTKKPTCTEPGVRTFTGTFLALFQDLTTQEFADTKEVEIGIDPDAHKWSQGECTLCHATDPNYVGVTVIESSGSFANEGAENLFDGNPETKWCSRQDNGEGYYVIFKPDRPSILVNYMLVDAKDTDKFENRKWSSWSIIGTNNPDSESWNLIDEREDFDDYKDVTFTTNCHTAYAYYRINVFCVESEDESIYIQQMADMNITWCSDVTIEDGKAFSTPVEFTVPSDQVSVARTFAASKPASVMLPFSIKASLISGAKFYEFKGVKYENNEWVADMSPVDNVEAYKPYLVILDDDNATGKVTFVNTSADVATFVVTPEASAMQTTDENGWTFKAVNAAKTWAEGDPEIGKAYGFAGKDKTYDDYSVAQGEFVKIAAGASAKPGRCYLMKEGPLTRATEGLPATIKVRFIVGSATGIGTLDTETGEMTLEGWYDLNGNKIEQPSKGGVYINNNKKVMVK